MNSVISRWALMTILAPMSATFGEIPERAEHVLEAILAVQSNDRNEWEKSRCVGVLDFVKYKSDELAVWDSNVRFGPEKIAAEFRIRHEISKREGPQAFDVVRVVADGERLLVGLFSNRIHPHGCRAEAWADDAGSFATATRGINMDPRSYLFPPIMRSSKDLEYFKSTEADVTCDDDLEEPTVLVRRKDRGFFRIKASTQIAYRIVKFEAGHQSDPELPHLILDYHWVNDGSGVRPAEVVMRQLDLHSKEGYHVYRMLVNTMKKDVTLSESDFSIENLHLCEGAVLIEHKEGVVPKARVADMSQTTNQITNHSIAETVEALPSREGTRPKVIVESKAPKKGWLSTVIVANVVAVIGIIMAWYLLRRAQ